MSDLVKVNNVSALVSIDRNVAKNTFSQKNFEIYNAHKGVMIKGIEDKNDIVNNIHVYINNTVLEKGVNMTVEEVNYLKMKITDDIFREFTTLTLEDVKLCLYLGVRYELGEYYGLNPVTFYGWLKKYKKELLPSMMLEAKPLLMKPIVDEEPKFNQDEVNKLLTNTILKKYNNVKKNIKDDFYDIGNIHYNFLNKLGLISFKEHELKSIRNYAVEFTKNKLREQNENFKSLGKNFHMVDIAKAFADIENGEGKKYNDMIEINFKHLCLNKFLEVSAESKVDLEKILKLKTLNVFP